MDYGGAEGLVLAADAAAAGFVYETAPDAVYRAAQSQVQLTLKADVLAIAIDERPYATRGHIDLDNSMASGGAGPYAGPPTPIAIGNLVAISWGYRTASGAQSSRMADVWIAGIEHRRTGGVSTLRLHVEGAWEILQRNTQRAQIVHAGGESYFAVLTRIFARAGLQLAGSSVSSRATSVTPQFTIAPGASGLEAIRAAIAVLADRVRLPPLAAALLTEPLPSAATQYTFGAAHALRDVRLRSEPSRAREVQTFGAAAYGEAIDFPNAALGLGECIQRRDLTSSTGGTAAATALAHLRQLALDTNAGRITVPPHCGLELLDVVDFTDALISVTTIKRRVAGITWCLDRTRGVYEQHIELGAM